MITLLVLYLLARGKLKADMPEDDLYFPVMAVLLDCLIASIGYYFFVTL